MKIDGRGRNRKKARSNKIAIFAPGRAQKICMAPDVVAAAAIRTQGIRWRIEADMFCRTVAVVRPVLVSQTGQSGLNKNRHNPPKSAVNQGKGLVGRGSG